MRIDGFAVPRVLRHPGGSPHASARLPGTRTAKPSRDKGMNSIRIKITIELNGNHALSDRDLTRLKPVIERGIAAALPDAISVDRIRVTKIKENTCPDKGSGDAATIAQPVNATNVAD